MIRAFPYALIIILAVTALVYLADGPKPSPVFIEACTRTQCVDL